MTGDQPAQIEEVFVQMIRSASVGPGSLTLIGTSPSTRYFADRPDLVVGHMTNEQFVAARRGGEDSFESDPPNAVLSFVAPVACAGD